MEIKGLVKEHYEDYVKLIDTAISIDQFNEFVDHVLGENHYILVIEKDNILIGTGTIFIENKLTHGGCKMGHIENILIDEKERGNGYGKLLVNELLKIGNERECYRVDLNCNAELEDFYKKSGLAQNGIHMNVYFAEHFFNV